MLFIKNFFTGYFHLGYNLSLGDYIRLPSLSFWEGSNINLNCEYCNEKMCRIKNPSIINRDCELTVILKTRMGI